MEEEIVRIPAERVKVLLGKERQTKELIEKKCDIRLKVDAEGEVTIRGESENVFFYKDVIIAIGRGFNPQKALKLTNFDYHFYLIHLKDHLSSDKAIKRIKGRIIGQDGKMREEIESATQCYLSVFGNTVGIIATIDTIEYAKEAVQMIINGTTHSSVYAFLGKARRRIIESKLKGK